MRVERGMTIHLIWKTLRPPDSADTLMGWPNASMTLKTWVLAMKVKAVWEWTERYLRIAGADLCRLVVDAGRSLTRKELREEVVERSRQGEPADSDHGQIAHIRGRLLGYMGTTNSMSMNIRTATSLQVFEQSLSFV